MVVPQTQYDKLEKHPREEIPYVIGRRTLRADYLYTMYANRGVTIDGIAKSKQLPETTIQQAIDWCKKNTGIVEKVWEEERRQAGLE